MVYPFYVTVDSNSRKSITGVGAKGKTTADMTIKVMQRENGESITPFRIRQYTTEQADGKILLVTQVYDENGCIVASKGTYY